MERPILFNTEMVNAVRDRRKTMTRRIVKRNLSGRVQLKHKQWHIEDENAYLACPYGIPGDRLWVRETFAGDSSGKIHYKADGLLKPPNEIINDEGKEVSTNWRPSIHMPRWASRINLEIASVRVERLQSISVDDIIKEGFSTKAREHDAFCDLHEKFINLWDSINAKTYPWSSNPWVWAIEFKVV